ncbi:hypothetical protein DMB66_23025 [Actinoplanes sp. ATCC 53533]|uniref:hypothetical protein n=1 Tax=Actinoplanes sp. ATCC 53533 TaxID=1288362 RepID=UPI000F779F78|nr:hypothetical protein [Actinoplanes sp. ATCC 53533]RSM62036.1 hypothetical protein DMB66_23025 [Actinoplanes sp. ATCC 53533]
MSRPQPCTAAPWLLRALLVLLTLTGLGIWQGGHCIGDTSAPQTTKVAALSVASATTTAMSAQHHDPHASGMSSTTADECSSAPTIVTRTTMTATSVLPAVERTAPVASSSRPSTPRCFAPSVVLTRLGVSRT